MYGRRVGSVRPGKYSQKQLHLVEIDETRAESRQKSGFGALFGRMGHVDTGPVAPGLALVMVEACEPPGVGTRCGRGPTSCLVSGAFLPPSSPWFGSSISVCRGLGGEEQGCPGTRSTTSCVLDEIKHQTVVSGVDSRTDLITSTLHPTPYLYSAAMSRQITQPLNQVRLTNVAVVRLSRHGHRFEVA
ncbi:hypothetical protein THAOC_04091 [Thalassiosira oceanica]|uniref:Uncharacterized protein n=1 Tax=Thalassiosira oceanica TaxID=159749 RepID=K0TAY1_THAOC|nr:hypothetical protein THAOC_04091 [Thalassiosira oceanica]|eukprot:EJK74244.1 hypothetical protein THAOC_04091 [Thalassiosira oceanica]